MTRELFIRPEAEQDVKDAFAWYERQREGLGSRFLISIEAALDSIHRNPLGYAEVHSGIRRILAKRFPYGIFYFVESDRLVVFAILHAARDPRLWQDRANIDPSTNP